MITIENRHLFIFGFSMFFIYSLMILFSNITIVKAVIIWNTPKHMPLGSTMGFHLSWNISIQSNLGQNSLRQYFQMKWIFLLYIYFCKMNKYMIGSGWVMFLFLLWDIMFSHHFHSILLKFHEFYFESIINYHFASAVEFNFKKFCTGFLQCFRFSSISSH